MHPVILLSLTQTSSIVSALHAWHAIWQSWPFGQPKDKNTAKISLRRQRKNERDSLSILLASPFFSCGGMNGMSCLGIRRNGLPRYLPKPRLYFVLLHYTASSWSGPILPSACPSIPAFNTALHDWRLDQWTSDSAF